jgi:hypothetical protein
MSSKILFSGTKSLISLQFIIKKKYSAVLKVEDGCVYAQDGIKDYLTNEQGAARRSSHSSEHATISMTITINNVNEELCRHFLWDLAHKAIWDKFKFEFDGDSPSGGLIGGSGHGRAIRVDEFDAHHTIVQETFKYLSKPPQDQTAKIGVYLVSRLPYHLDKLQSLQDQDKGTLLLNEALEIGQNLYNLFKDEKVFRRHKASFEQVVWNARQIEDVQKWLMDSTITRKLDTRWRKKVQRAASPTRGYLREFVTIVVKGFLQERSWDVQNACSWIWYFMEVVSGLMVYCSWRKLADPP